MRGDSRPWRILVLLGLLSTTAAAEPSFVAPTRSTVLFVEARELATTGKVEEACQRFEASWQLEHAIGTALNLGNCRERQGKLVEAWQLYQDAERAAEQAHDAERAAFARNRSAAIEPHMTTLEITLAEPIAEGISITINGQVVAPRPTIRERLEVGPIEIRVTSPGGAKHTRRLDPQAGDLHVIVPSLVRTRTERPHRYVVLAGSLLATGVVATGLGVWVGNVAASERGAFETWSARNCPFDISGTPSCGGVAHEIAVQKLADVQKLENTSTGILIGSGLVTATAAVVWWAAPREHIVITPSVTTSSFSVAVSSRF